MEDTKDELTEYFHTDKVERINHCVIRLAEYKDISVEKLFEEHPELKEKYVYLKGRNVLIDRQRAAEISQPTGIAAFEAEDVITLIESSVLANPNIHFNLILHDTPEGEKLADVYRFREVRQKLEGRIDPIDSVEIRGRGYGLMTNISYWKDEEIRDLLFKVRGLNFNITQPNERIEKIRDIIRSTPELNEDFLTSGHYFTNTRKTRNAVNNEGIEFDRNPDEPSSLFWRKLAMFIKNSPFCVVEQNLSGISEIYDIPEEFLDVIDESSKARFVIPSKKEGKPCGIYSAYSIKQTRLQLDALRKGIEAGWTDEELAEFLEGLEYFDIEFIQDESLADRIKNLYKTNPNLSKKYVFTEKGTAVLNVEKCKLIGNEIFGEDRDPEDRTYYEKIATLAKNNPGIPCKVKVSGVKELSIEDLETLAKGGESIQIEIAKGKYDERGTIDRYSVSEMLEIRKRLEELLADVDPNLPELARFGNIYRRVCMAFTYDYPAAYPKTPEEEEYSRKNSANARNLRNALLEGKCVCAGFADVLRNALDMFGIEAEYVLGDCIDAPIPEEEYEAHKDEEQYKFKRPVKQENGQVILGEKHAWVKVKINGRWYNCDPTFDSSNYARGDLPKYALIPDSEISGNGHSRIGITGPECVSPNLIDEEISKSNAKDEDIKEKTGPDKPGGRFSKFFTDLYERIKRVFSRRNQKLLEDGLKREILEGKGKDSAEETKAQEEKYPSWDLRNYKDFKLPKVPSENKDSVERKELNSKEIDDGR